MLATGNTPLTTTRICWLKQSFQGVIFTWILTVALLLLLLHRLFFSILIAALSLFHLVAGQENKWQSDSGANSNDEVNSDLVCGGSPNRQITYRKRVNCRSEGSSSRRESLI
ncbi:hypothetical protein FRB94_007655 [Tulasnella sp. JGI-2019a]|nr:hypothetical protein FRB93_007325 [Tulasnella sp. JGI-2019a]KAG8997429.1 hypothetical protein FRB94_007655 [Tulasnella sp. JGI-2019a]